MPSWAFDPDRMDDDYMASGAGRYQQAVERGERERREFGWQAPDGWARPHEPVCPRCWYVVVDGDCVNGHASLSERADYGTAQEAA